MSETEQQEQQTPEEPANHPGPTDDEQTGEPNAPGATPDSEAPGYGEPTQTEGEGAQEGAPEPTTVGDLQAPADEHPVDSTPALGDVDKGESPAAGGPTGVTPDETPEQMNRADERGEPNARGAGGGDGTVWNGPEDK